MDILVDDSHLYALEHLPIDQAEKVIADVEAYLIRSWQPAFNSHYRAEPKMPWKPISVHCHLLESNPA
jgi:hypothetical protein